MIPSHSRGSADDFPVLMFHLQIRLCHSILTDFINFINLNGVILEFFGEEFFEFFEAPKCNIFGNENIVDFKAFLW